MKTFEVYKKIERAEAIFLTEDNIEEVGRLIGAEFCGPDVVRSSTRPQNCAFLKFSPRILGFVGDWAVLYQGPLKTRTDFYTTDRFMNDFSMARFGMNIPPAGADNRSKVLELLYRVAVKQDAATYHQDSSAMPMEIEKIADEIINLFK